MNKIQVSISALLILFSSGAFAATSSSGWQTDCASIEQSTKTQGTCTAIQNQVQALQPYAPIVPFQDTTVYNQNKLNDQFPWGTPQWAGGGSTSGGGVLPDQSSDGGTNGTGTNTTPTFQ